MQSDMNTKYTLFSLFSASAFCITAQAADAPGALAGYDLPTGDQAKIGFAIAPAFSEKFQELQKEVIGKINSWDEEKRVAYAKDLNLDYVLPYHEELWADQAAYAEYKKEWSNIGMQAAAEVALSVQDAGNGLYRFYAITNVSNTGQKAPVSISGLNYDPAKNVWTSSHGELTAKEFKTTDDYIFKAQTGTEWKLEKEDSFAKTVQMLRISKTTDNKATFLTYQCIEVSKITGSVLSNQSYTLLFPIKQAKLDIGAPGTR